MKVYIVCLVVVFLSLSHENDTCTLFQIFPPENESQKMSAAQLTKLESERICAAAYLGCRVS